MTLKSFSFHVTHTEGAARCGIIKTARGDIATPIFMPVGTLANVKTLTVDMLLQAQAKIILGNTYHLMLRPGAERLERFGGLHQFMNWHGPILTDSGGFQVMSLSKIAKVTEDSVTFSSHIDGSKHVLTPEKSIDIQANKIKADISMQLDECISYPATHDRAAQAMNLSARWGRRCKEYFGERNSQALFGIQQGSTFDDLRKESTDQLIDIGFDGYAVGGLAVGEGHEQMVETLSHCAPLLPFNKPRYLMGVGKPIDLVEAIYHGIDMFDCVLPTRSGRHGQAFTWDGAINLNNSCFKDDIDPIDAQSHCPASAHYSKAYLHHLVKSNEILGQMLLSWHNISFYLELMSKIRTSIEHKSFNSLRNELKQKWMAKN